MPLTVGFAENFRNSDPVASEAPKVLSTHFAAVGVKVLLPIVKKLGVVVLVFFLQAVRLRNATAARRQYFIFKV
jgi:hypothetical protein